MIEYNTNITKATDIPTLTSMMRGVTCRSRWLDSMGCSLVSQATSCYINRLLQPFVCRLKAATLYNDIPNSYKYTPTASTAALNQLQSWPQRSYCNNKANKPYRRYRTLPSLRPLYIAMIRNAVTDSCQSQAATNGKARMEGRLQADPDPRMPLPGKPGNRSYVDAAATAMPLRKECI